MRPIVSLNHQTDLMMAGFRSQILDRGDYLLVRTPQSPGFHWGNYLLWERAPVAGDLERWRALFRQEFPDAGLVRHEAFTWDTFEPGGVAEFLGAGFQLHATVALSTQRVEMPPRTNLAVSVRPVVHEAEFEAAIEGQLETRDPAFDRDRYFDFCQRQMALYREMIAAGRGLWWGAFAGEELVGSLGVFHSQGLARYQVVTTHRQHQRQGICARLVYEAGRHALEHFGVHTLVMAAEAGSDAARIYQSAGFCARETSYALSRF